MPESRSNRPPVLPNTLSLPLMTGSVIVFFVMLALPISQIVSGTPEPPPPPLDTTTMDGPPDIPPQDIKEQPKDDPPPLDFKNPPEPPPIDFIATVMDPDLSGYGSSDYSISYGTFGNTGIEDTLYQLDQLTRAPRAIRQQAPVYPHELKVAGIEGSVVLTFVVNPDGTTSRVQVVESTNPGFERPAVASARKWLFQPGEKDGKQVKTIVRIEIPFQIRGNL